MPSTESATSSVIHHEILRGGDKWSGVIKRGRSLRLTAGGEGACVVVLLFNAAQLLERFNMPDTLKAQHTAFLTSGRVLLSDMGHVLASITHDTCGWHDCLSGHQDAAGSQARFGNGNYQKLRNDFPRNSRDNLLIELGKWGLGRRDLHANLNCFAKVQADDSGALRWVPGHCRSGSAIELRMEMDVLAVLSNTPHPLDPRTTYAPPPVELSVRTVPPPGPDDQCRVSRPENARAFQLTEALFA